MVRLKRNGKWSLVLEGCYKVLQKTWKRDAADPHSAHSTCALECCKCHVLSQKDSLVATQGKKYVLLPAQEVFNGTEIVQLIKNYSWQEG